MCDVVFIRPLLIIIVQWGVASTFENDKKKLIFDVGGQKGNTQIIMA